MSFEKLLETELGRNLLTVWCNCHRSDLALEDIEDAIPELKAWKKNAVACATYFRTSKCRTKLLKECAEQGVEILSFPAHNEIRFAEHGEGLLKAIILNLPACRKAWRKIIENPSAHTSKDVSKASDLLNCWTNESKQFKLTSFMYDIYKIFTSLQKGLQKSFIILPDVITLRDAAMRKFDVICAGPMPGGEEEKALKLSNEKDQTIRSHLTLVNQRAQYNDIRSKVTQNAREFLAQRLDIETEKSIDLMKNILNTTTCETLITHSVDAMKQFIKNEEQDKITELVSDI